MKESETGICNILESMDPESPEFADIAALVAKKTARLRSSNGVLPYNLFLSSVEMLGISPCIELLIFDRQNNLYLKERKSDENATEAEEKAWGGKLHLPGTTIFPRKKFGMNLFGLIDKEMVGVEGSEKRKVLAKVYKESRVVGVAVHSEPARNTDALKVYVRVVIDDPKILKDGYEKVNNDNINRIIEDHKKVVIKILEYKCGPMLFDTR